MMTRLPKDHPLIQHELSSQQVLHREWLRARAHPVTEAKNPSKMLNRRTYSELIGRWFSSKGECRRGEELYLLQEVGQIKLLDFQQRFVLSKKPMVSIVIDYIYLEKDEGGKWRYVYEDYKAWDKKTSKPRIEESFRIKLAWLKEKYMVDVRIMTERGEWEQ